jgi:SAM-dependent methyltransferase
MVIRSSVWAYLGRQLRHPSGSGAVLIWPAMALANRQPNRVAIAALDIAPHDTVLELGFGPGRALQSLTAMASRGRVLGIDHSARMLAQAMRRNRAAISEGRLALHHGPFDRLPWAAKSVDKILAVNVAYFFGADGAEVREARRVLRPGGRLAIFAIDRRAMARWRFAGPDTHRAVDRHALRALVLSGGFAAEEISINSLMMPLGIPALLAIADKAPEARHVR